MTVLDVSKYPDRSSRTSSASRDSESVVKPTRSANRTETSRRSATGAVWAAPAAAGVAAGPAAASGEPHSPQNFCPGGFAAPHEEQVAASAVPHSPQNFCVAGFSAPQFEHVVTVE